MSTSGPWSHILRFSMPTAILLMIVLAAIATSGCLGFTGCNLFDSKFIYSNSYTVTVTGLSNYTGGDGFRLLLPAPLVKGTPAFTEEQVRAGMLIFPPPVSVFADYQTVHTSQLVNNTGWTAALVNTEHGQMIEFSASNASPSDFMYILIVTKDVPGSEREKYPSDTNPAGDGPLYPLSSDSAGSFTVPVNNSYGNYSSYLFIAGPIPGQSVSVGNISVSVDYHELFAEGSVPTFRQSCQINESIPASVSGWIPVTVWKTE